MPSFPSFRIVSLMATALCLGLSLVLIFLPNFIYELFALTGNDTSNLLAKRAAMLFLGFAFLLFASRNTNSKETVDIVSLSMCVTFAGLICAGSYEFFTGTAGPGIWLAISGESIFIVLFLAARMSFTVINVD